MPEPQWLDQDLGANHRENNHLLAISKCGSFLITENGRDRHTKGGMGNRLEVLEEDKRIAQKTQ